MTAADPSGPERFRFLAASVAGRAVDVAEARAGEAAHTNGRVIFVSADGSAARQRSEVLVQSALLGAGSLDQRWVKALWARPSVARRYLALEGRRVLAGLAGRYPVAADLGLDGNPSTTTAHESLEFARGRAAVPDPPEWFGAIKPSRLLSAPAGPGARATDKEVRLEFDPIDLPEADDDGDREQSRESRILKLFENPLIASRTLTDYFRKLLGGSRASADGAAGAEAKVRSVRRTDEVGRHARSLSTRIRFTDDDRPGAAIGVGGALHPEWDVHAGRYRPDWCRVIGFPLTAAADISAAAVPRDDVLRRRLSRVGLGPAILRGRRDGDEIDVEALIDLFVDVRSGHSPPEHVYLDRRKIARDLGVLILLDASGSATDADPGGLAVHDHQRRAAATLAATLEELGDRVAVHAFRSHGRHAVQLPAVKAFGQRFDAVGRARLARLQPSGYTRLGAGIRGAAEILKTEAGTPHRLLIVLSDGFPYDNGYEGRYAEADVRKALEELHADGVACLCLSIGATTTVDALERVFGPASHASAATLAELSPRMDELFLAALRRLAAPKPK
ncbi:nitric oxide reductase activation protein NorD [Actinomadura montaniterrae]|uniref:VWA domain-containing protein n=1 Tax=Actinomadura montaniterrae TaxID=1803903 RepID=A0A6L3W1N6_9ACTN|nr:VWA domain-containing protein [Actinomadura montaniterrae]KAB2381267.1 VWA domain-containing protein [Actinomadura montaniterrae]